MIQANYTNYKHTLHLKTNKNDSVDITQYSKLPLSNSVEALSIPFDCIFVTFCLNDLSHSVSLCLRVEPMIITVVNTHLREMDNMSSYLLYRPHSLL